MKQAMKKISTAMTVVRLDVDNYKRLRAAHVTPSPTGLVPVRGRNAAGKSSLIESMLAALLGKKGKTELPITEGAHGAEVIVDFGDIVVTRRWTRDSGGKAKTTLTVEDSDGVPRKGPQAILDSLVGRFADPVAFLDMTAAEQVKTVLGVLGLDEELDELEDVAAGWFERRRDLGRDSDRLGKALAAISLEVEGLPAPPSDGTIEELTIELRGAETHNAALAAAQSTMASSLSRGQDAAKRLERLEAEVVKLQDEIAAQRTIWSEASVISKAAEPIDPAPIAERLQAHEAVARHAGRRELLESTRSQHEAAQQAHAEADDALDNARTAIAELLDAAEFPIEGMHYDADAKTITIGGIPFSQASQAERLKTAAAVAMAGDPAIKVMFVKEGSLLDDESMNQLAELAEAASWQLWCERVDSNAEGTGVWISDGIAYGEDDDKPA